MIVKAIISLFLTLLTTTQQKALANKPKYQFGGDDNISSTGFFNQLTGYLKEDTVAQPTTLPTEPEDSADVEDVEDSTTSEDYSALLEQFTDLSQEYENLKTSQSRFQDSGDSFLSFLFADDTNMPTVFSKEELDPQYVKRAVQPPFALGKRETAPATTLDPDKYLAAIYGNEGGKTGVDPAIRGRASGKYALMPAARKDVYNAHFKGAMSYSQFEKLYNTDASFEYQVARKLAEDKINKSKTVAEAFGSWYSPAHAHSGQFNVVPRPDYGNRITVGQYAQKAIKSYRQYGGEVNDTDSLYKGLNNSEYDSLTLDLPPQYNLIRGLDNGQPVYLKDESGNEQILKGSNDTAHMFGKVYEQKL